MSSDGNSFERLLTVSLALILFFSVFLLEKGKPSDTIHPPVVPERESNSSPNIDSTVAPAIAEQSIHTSRSEKLRIAQWSILSEAKYPFRITESTPGQTIEFSGSHLLVGITGLDDYGFLEMALRNSPFRIAEKSGMYARVEWSEPDLDRFYTMESLLRELLPKHIVARDSLRELAGYQRGEYDQIPGQGDPFKLNWLYESDYDAEGILIALIDSGVDLEHYELDPDDWKNLSETVDGTDTDGNGFIDDVAGWDFYDNDNDPSDEDGHGTAMAGLIAARPDNNTGIAGYAPGSRLLSIRFSNSEGSGFDSDAIKAINYASKMGCDVINASWGGDYNNPLMEQAIQSFTAKGGIFVCAAGNAQDWLEERPQYPACFTSPGIATVSAEGFNYSRLYVDYPGIGSAHTLVLGLATAGRHGTSVATAIMSGFLAVAKNHYPDLSPQELIDSVGRTFRYNYNFDDLARFSGYADYERMINGLVSPVPRIVGHTINTEMPAYFGEVIEIQFEVEGDEHYQLVFEHDSGLDWKFLNPLRNTGIAESEDLMVKVFGLLGSTDYQPIRLERISSPPFPTVSIPDFVEGSQLTSPLPIELEFSGNQPINLELYLNGKNFPYENFSLINSIDKAGTYTIRVSNSAGVYEHTITVPWEGMVPLPRNEYENLNRLSKIVSGKNAAVIASGDGTYYTRDLATFEKLTDENQSAIYFDGIDFYTLGESGLYRFSPLNGEFVRIGDSARHWTGGFLTRYKGIFIAGDLGDRWYYKKPGQEWKPSDEEVYVTNNQVMLKGELIFTPLDLYIENFADTGMLRGRQYKNGTIWIDNLLLPNTYYDLFYSAESSWQNPGWYQDSIFGWFYTNDRAHSDSNSNYLFSPLHGWLYISNLSSQSGTLFDQKLGWMYYHPFQFPYLYQYSEASWLYYLEGSNNPRWFYDMSLGEWRSVP